MTETYSRERLAAIEAVRHAARVCQAVQSTITDEVLKKKDRSPVTVADFSSQAIVCRRLEQEFPSDPVVGEEDSHELREAGNAPFLERVCQEVHQVGIEGDAKQICHWIDRGGAHDFSERFWTLDPIDGTKGFLRGEQYAISLALIINGRIDVAVLGCPNLSVDPDSETPTGVLYAAVRGQGVECLTLTGDDSGKPVAVSQVSDAAQARLCESVESGHSAHGRSARIAGSLHITRPPVRLDSQAKYAVVARGEADVYLRLPTRPDYREKIWDHAGGVLVVEEAGGVVTDIKGQPLEFTHGRELTKNLGVVVSNGHIHDQVIAAVRASYDESN